MRYSPAVDDAASVTSSLIQKLEPILSSTSLTLFRALLTIALEAAAVRGYSPKVSQVSFFCPVEAVALALGVHRSTVYRALRALRELGLVDERGHYTTHNGRTVSDGAVWCVRLRPLEGRAARLQYGDLKRQYRALGADIERGRTVWALMRQSKDSPQEGINLNQIRAWALPPTPRTPGMSLDCGTAARADLEALLDVTAAPWEDRAPAVRLAAEALSQALRDRDGENFYRRLCWALLRRYDSSGQDYSYAIYLAAQRARTDALENFARKPGALFTSRLKTAPWWSPVWESPPNRVGSPPLNA